MNLLTKIGNGIDAFKGAFSTNAPYSVLNNGSHTYNYETIRHGFLGLFGNDYFSPSKNLKSYYEGTPFFQDCINLYCDIASQVKIQEVDRNGNIVENSEFLKLLEQPNYLQDQIGFIKEMVINVLTTGINVQNGSFFKNGNLRINPEIYNIDFFNLEFPKIKNRYTMRRKEYEELTFKERLNDGKIRNLKFYELAFVYDSVAKNTFGKNGYNSSQVLNPISRVFALRKDLHILKNTADTMVFMSGKNVNWIISKRENNNALPDLPKKQKSDIERKISGNGNYGMKVGKSDIIATNQDLQLLNLTRDNRKLQIIEMQNNAKENVRNAYGIPRDLLDAFNGNSRGSTYENQQFAEARFTLNNVKNITDSWLYSLENKCKSYFQERGTRLIGTYDHMPSVVAINTKLKNDGFKAKSEALMKFLEAFEKSKQLGLDMNYDDFLKSNGFQEFLKTNQLE